MPSFSCKHEHLVFLFLQCRRRRAGGLLTRTTQVRTEINQRTRPDQRRHAATEPAGEQSTADGLEAPRPRQRRRNGTTWIKF